MTGGLAPRSLVNVTGRRLDDQAVRAKTQGLSRQNITLVAIGDHQHAVPVKDVHNHKGQVGLCGQCFGSIGAQSVLATQFATARQPHSLVRAKDYITRIVGQYAVEVVGVPCGLPRLCKGIEIHAAYARTICS